MGTQMPDMWNKGTPLKETSTPFDVDWLKTEVGKQFPFYDTRIHGSSIIFFVRIDEQTLEDNFNHLRQRLAERGYIPLLRYEKGEHLIYIIQKPKRREKPRWINLVLLIATLITTILTGSLLHIGASDLWSVTNVAQVFAPENLLYGAVFFSLPLMSILLIHEMGHYFISKRHGITTSLPYFLPIPPILPGFNIGTFGALISSGDPMPNKKALFDVGISGPLAGFLVAIPITIIGIVTSDLVELSQMSSGEPILGTSLLFLLLVDTLRVIPAGFTINLNAIAFAGWIGLLITSINLLPAGQLDGGHIFRAVLGEKQKYAGWIAVFIMIFTGWTFFAIIIIFLIGMMHPPPLNDDSALDTKRKLLFFVALGILLLCFIPFPIFQI
jgi:membrane-associated protease RseP (regulator of RpoE activity)